MPVESTILIQELSGEERRIELSGAALPDRGVEWGIEGRLVTKFYEGSQEALQQVLGPVLIPTDWKGMWRTPMLVSSPVLYSATKGATPERVVTAHVIAEIFESFAMAQRLCRVVWTNKTLKIERIGRMNFYRPTYERADDVGWSINWAWIAKTLDTQAPLKLRTDTDARAIAKLAIAFDLTAYIAETTPPKRTNKNVLNSATPFTIGDLETLAELPKLYADTLINKGKQAASAARRITALLDKAPKQPAEIVDRAVGVARETRVAFTGVVKSIGRLPAELASDDPNVGAVARAFGYTNAIGLSAQQSSADASVYEQYARKVLSSLDKNTSPKERAAPADILVVHLAKRGDTFATISLRYYGTISLAGTIARANGFKAFELSPTPGTALSIPSKTPSLTSTLPAKSQKPSGS